MFFHFSDGTAYQVLVAGYDPTSHCPSSPTSPVQSSPSLGGPGTIQKQLELAPFIESISQSGKTTSVDLKVVSAALIRLADKAFERRSSVSQSQHPSPRTRKVSRQFTSSSNTSSEDQDHSLEHDQDMDVVTDETPSTPIPIFSEQRWNQHHMSLALKFEGIEGWHCISAIMQSRSTSSNSTNGFFGNWGFSNANASNTSLSSPTSFLSPPPDANGEIFRSYEDIYIIRVADRHSPPNINANVNTTANANGNGLLGGSAKKKHIRQNSEWSEWSFGSS